MATEDVNALRDVIGAIKECLKVGENTDSSMHFSSLDGIFDSVARGCQRPNA